MIADKDPVAANIVDVDGENFATEVIEASYEQLVLVDFWASWCGPCQSLTPILEKLAAQYATVKLVKVDTEANEEMTASFGIRSLPTVFLFKDGAPVDHFMGLQTEEVIRQMLEHHGGSPGPAGLTDAEQAYSEGQRTEAVALVRQLIQSAPDDDEPKRLLLKWLCAEGEVEEAATVAASLSEAGQDSAEYRAWQSGVEMREAVKELPPETELLAVLERDENNHTARMQYAQHLIARQQTEQGLEQLLEIVRRERGEAGEAARKMMVDTFASCGDAALVSQYRKLLARALY